MKKIIMTIIAMSLSFLVNANVATTNAQPVNNPATTPDPKPTPQQDTSSNKDLGSAPANDESSPLSPSMATPASNDEPGP